MRVTQWAVGVVVATALAGATACGGTEVTVRPAGGSPAGSACVQDGAGTSVCADADGSATADAPGAGIKSAPESAAANEGQGAGISIGPGGTTITDGQGSGVSIGLNGASVTAGSSSGGSAAGGDPTGTVELTGAVNLRGNVYGGCNWRGPETRLIYVQPNDQTLLGVQIYHRGAASVSLQQGERTWGVDYLGNAGDVMTMGDGSIELRGVRMVGQAGTVNLTASFNC